MSSRTITIFLELINSKKTREQYLYYLQSFVTYYKLRDIESIITIEPGKLQEMIEDFVIHLKRENLSRSYINGHKSALKAIIETNDILLNWSKISRLMPEQKKKRGQKAWKRTEIETMLKSAYHLKARALILFMTCGCRIGGIPDLKMKDMTDMPDGCKKLIIYRGTKDEYVTFMTPEASEAYEKYLQKRINDGERIDRNSPVFRNHYQLGMQKVRPVSARSLAGLISRIQKIAGLRDESTKISGRYETATDHGFRKYFNTIAKSTDGINRTLVEKMMGHNSQEIPLDTEYYDEEMVPELSFEQFRKIIPKLTIDDAARKQAQLEQKEKKLSELEQETSSEMAKMRKELTDMKREEKEKWEEVRKWVIERGSCGDSQSEPPL